VSPPPLSENADILVKLDRLVASLDRLEARLQRLEGERIGARVDQLQKQFGMSPAPGFTDPEK
jgi:hypothetical protein